MCTYRYLYAVVGMEAFHDVDRGDSVLSYSAYDCQLGFQDFRYVSVAGSLPCIIYF